MGITRFSPVAQLRGKCPQLLIEAPLIGKLVRKAFTALFGHHHPHIGLQTLGVAPFVQREVHHTVPFRLPGSCEGPHGREKSQHLLDVVGRIIRLLPHLRHQVDRVIGHRFKPRMGRVQLVAQDETQRFHAAGEDVDERRHRSLQYFTSSQQRAHFLRQSNGRPHWTQSLEGRCGLRCMWIEHHLVPAVHPLMPLN